MENRLIYIILGTRAQFIKMAPIIKELDKRKIKYKFIYTAQHKETIDEIRNNFLIRKPDFSFNFKNETKSIKLFGLWILKATWILLSKKKIIIPKKGLILTHGDTITCLWAAILGKTRNCKVMHIESGLRSYNIFNPFPEEIIRLMVFRFSDIFVCPNNWAKNNLKRYKGIKINTYFNTQYDSLRLALQNKVTNKKFKYVVISIHRFENLFNKKRLAIVLKIINKISLNIKIYFVLHPSTKNRLIKLGYFTELKKIKSLKLLDRLSFFSFINLISNSEFVITDGGSNQEELYYLGKPTLILRKKTERKEGLGKNAVLSNFDLKAIDEFLMDYNKYKTKKIIVKKSPSKIIVDWIEKKYL